MEKAKDNTRAFITAWYGKEDLTVFLRRDTLFFDINRVQQITWDEMQEVLDIKDGAQWEMLASSVCVKVIRRGEDELLELYFVWDKRKLKRLEMRKKVLN